MLEFPFPSAAAEQLVFSSSPSYIYISYFGANQFPDTRSEPSAAEPCIRPRFHFLLAFISPSLSAQLFLICSVCVGQQWISQKSCQLCTLRSRWMTYTHAHKSNTPAHLSHTHIHTQSCLEGIISVWDVVANSYPDFVVMSYLCLWCLF